MTVIEKKKAQILALEKATADCEKVLHDACELLKPLLSVSADCGKSEKAIRKEYAKRAKSALRFIGSNVTGGDE